MKLHDISMPLVAGMAVWPGDPPFGFRQNASQGNGDDVNVGEIRQCVHTGTHVDSPWHVDSAGATLDKLDLSIFLGPAAVIDVRGEFVGPEELERGAAAIGESIRSMIRRAPRLLLRTMSWTDRTAFPSTFATLNEAAARLLVDSGAQLLGVDVPSVDTRENTSLPIHHTLIGRHRVGDGVQILENLVLDAVSSGFYELIALPLSIVGADGSPVRAVLVER